MSDPVFSTPTDVSSMRDKVALVTGGASGLGRATCYALAGAGVEVVVADVSEDAGRAVAEAIGGHFVTCDVRTLEANEAAVAFAVETCGSLDYVHLNAGVASLTAPGPSFDLERYRLVMGVNLDGVVFGTQAALPALKAAGGGAMVATASLAGLVASPFDPFYGANKHAVVGFARAMGPALAGDGIRFNAVCPSFAESEIIAPIRGDLEATGFEIIPAETVAETVVRLMASTDVTGQCWYVQARREPAEFVFRNVPGPGSRETV